MKLKVMQTVETEIDTDTFTPDQWKEFIILYVSTAEIVRTMKIDLFGLDRLKVRAIQMSQFYLEEL